MKKYTLYPVILAHSFFCVAVHQKVQYVRYIEEKVNGALFAHRVDIVDGETQDRWFVNGKKVEDSVYEDMILDAEREERRVERRRVENRRKQEELDETRNQDFLKMARLDIAKKRLNLTVKEIEVELARVREPKLEQYLVFGKNAIASPEQFQNLQIDLVPGAKKLLQSYDTAQEDELSTLVDTLDPYALQLREMFRSTVKNAINKCDDTRLLKELLEIVA